MYYSYSGNSYLHLKSRLMPQSKYLNFDEFIWDCSQCIIDLVYTNFQILFSWISRSSIRRNLLIDQ